MFNDCHLDGRDAGAGGGMRRVIAWVVEEEGTGAVFILDVVASDGAAAYPAGTPLRRQVSALQRHGLRRQARVAEEDPGRRGAARPRTSVMR